MQGVMKAERTIVIAADHQQVWHAITQPEQFGAWFGIAAKWDKLAPGETMTMEFTELNITEYATIAAVEPPDRFAFHWTAEEGSSVRTLVTFMLETVPGGTRVTVSEAGFEALPEDVRQKRYEMNDDGWRQQLDNLSAYLMQQAGA